MIADLNDFTDFAESSPIDGEFFNFYTVPNRRNLCNHLNLRF